MPRPERREGRDHRVHGQELRRGRCAFPAAAYEKNYTYAYEGEEEQSAYYAACDGACVVLRSDSCIIVIVVVMSFVAGSGCERGCASGRYWWVDRDRWG